MHYNWIIYPEGFKRIREMGLEERIKKALARHKKSTIPNHIFEPEGVLADLDELKEEGYFKTMPFNFVRDFGNDVYQDWHESLLGLVKRAKVEEDSYWQIFRYKGRQLEPVSLEDDFPMLSGFNASITLKPRIFWQFEWFGFNSLSDFFGTIGAFTRMKAIEYMERGAKWQSKESQKTFETEVTGSEHGDFRLFRRDITPYKTIDPLGSQVAYRPETREDVRGVSASHSVEPYILAAILKYAEQEKISSEILRNYPDFLAEMRKGNSFLGNFADAGDWGMGGERAAFFCHDYDIPRINSEGRVTVPYHKGIPCYGNDGGYFFLVGQNREFVFSYESREKRKEQGKDSPVDISVSIPAGELDNFIRALFLQAKRGLGRTSLNQMVKIMEYYFSEQFKIDREETEKMFRKSR